jgi:hypothetical protein
VLWIELRIITLDSPTSWPLIQIRLTLLSAADGQLAHTLQNKRQLAFLGDRRTWATYMRSVRQSPMMQT